MPLARLRGLRLSVQLLAALDERTTHLCRSLHGKTFAAADALRTFEQAEQLDQPEDMKRLRLRPDAA